MWVSYTCGPAIHVDLVYTKGPQYVYCGCNKPTFIIVNKYGSCWSNAKFYLAYYTCGPPMHVGVQYMYLGPTCIVCPHVLWAPLAHMYCGPTCIVGPCIVGPQILRAYYAHKICIVGPHILCEHMYCGPTCIVCPHI